MLASRESLSLPVRWQSRRYMVGRSRAKSGVQGHGEEDIPVTVIYIEIWKQASDFEGLWGINRLGI